ncbi:chemotaxis protein CheC [Chloroflexota bacterium]
MNKNTQLFTEEQLDFVKEMMNIGAGNAATALHHLLQCQVDLIIPKVHILPVVGISSILDNPTSLVACVRMGMVGNISGAMFFIVPEESRKELVSIAEKALLGLNKLSWQKSEEVELSAIIEIGNILSGVYLTAIHDFCGLNIYHTVPVLSIDMIQPLLDEALITTSIQIQTSVLIENEFVIEDHHIRTMLLIIPSSESVKPMIDALEEARKAYGSA